MGATWFDLLVWPPHFNKDAPPEPPLGRGIPNLVSVESVASGIKDELVAAKKQCRIQFPNPLASSSESPNLELKLLDERQEWEWLGSTFLMQPPQFDKDVPPEPPLGRGNPNRASFKLGGRAPRGQRGKP